MKKYFKVRLTDGTVLDFDKKCDQVDYSGVNYVIFKQTVNAPVLIYNFLAIIPHKSIFSIMRCKEE